MLKEASHIASDVSAAWRAFERAIRAAGRPSLDLSLMDLAWWIDRAPRADGSEAGSSKKIYNFVAEGCQRFVGGTLRTCTQRIGSHPEWSAALIALGARDVLDLGKQRVTDADVIALVRSGSLGKLSELRLHENEPDHRCWCRRDRFDPKAFTAFAESLTFQR